MKGCGQPASVLFLSLLTSYVTTSGSSSYDDLEPCKESDCHYELTECDADKGRWRVKVPLVPGSCAGQCSGQVTRVDSCRISCEPGSYFNLAGLTCRKCRPGTYSLGGGALFDTWDTLPEGFYSQVESFRSSFSSMGRLGGDVNCSRYGWEPRGDFIASLGGPCAATLTYTVHLVKPGNLTYIYQYSDKDVIVFDFEAQNEQCQSVGDTKIDRWPSATKEGEWKKQVIHLKAGQNVLQWKTIGMDCHKGKPVLIKSVEITGVAFASSCAPCRPGTYSFSGSRTCTECPKNHYSSKEASSCSPCDSQTEYSPKGSSKCLTRPLCTVKDYYETRTPCDTNNQTQKLYEWIQPKICRDDDPESAHLPPPSERHACPPCNPGMEYKNGSTCKFCPLDHFSDGKSGCLKCPPNTTPNYGYQFERWSEMPNIMSTACIEPDGSACSTAVGWQPAGSYIHSGHRHTDGAYLLLSLTVPGFRNKGGISAGHRLEAGRISFTFQLDCKGKCEFVFMQGSETKGVTSVQSWMDSQPRQEFSHAILQNDSYTFSWVFQNLQYDQGYYDRNTMDSTSTTKFEDDIAKIFTVNITNTIDGGAASCLPCHQDINERGCIPCPLGEYIDPNTTECVPCPPDTTVSDPLAYGIESCQPCGPGLRSIDGVTCTTKCIFNVNNMVYDLRSLASPYLVKGSRLFTASGAQYFHLFNVSLCGLSAAQCSNNVSYQAEGQISQVKSFICRTTIVPSPWAEEGLILSTQSVTLGDELISISRDHTFMNMEVIEEFINPDFPNDLHFYYSTPLATRSCPQGRTTIITLHCNPTQVGNGTISLPTKCPDGTCDGCNFNFKWESDSACPLCAEEDYKLVKGECIDGVQSVHYLTPSHCIMPPSMPSSEKVSCTAHIPMELQILISVIVALAIFLCALMVYFWKKTQSLEYKYMKLVQSSSNRDGGETENNLAPAESCALDDGEEEEIQFTQPRSQGILNRIKAMTGKNEKGNPFETIHLTK
ncbi:endosome/lysosome-associated apoptosis and autophagy regulator family member 2-like [Hetaerina americana]|uniref:endosome/lysosome-associated apoptosis and autophagy regulator family member 2-like n=1 Tax=Hetaerina americana TaxID=62018 RepID=UPI003A7F2913